MERIELLLFLFFLMGLAVGMIAAGIYNVYEFNKANREIMEMKSICQYGKPYEHITGNINISVNFT